MWNTGNQAAFEGNHSTPKIDPLGSIPDERPRRSFRDWCWKIAKWSFLFFVIGLVWSVITDPSNEWPGFHLLQSAMMIPFAAILVVVIIVFPFAFGWSMWKALSAAVDAVQTPIPSLQEIEAQLHAEGHDPSIADCVAVDGYLRRNRNEKIAIGAAFVIIAHGL